MIIATSSGAFDPSSLDQRPKKVVIIRDPGTQNAVAKEVLLNPTTLREVISVEWSRLPVIGLDREIPHYSRTKSIEIPMSFLVTAFEMGRSRPNVGTMDFANFFRSLCFPTRSGMRPPTVKVEWFNILPSFYAVVSNLSLEYRRFDRTLAPIVYQADVTFLEVRLDRRWSEDVAEKGLEGDLEGKPASATEGLF